MQTGFLPPHREPWTQAQRRWQWPEVPVRSGVFIWGAACKGGRRVVSSEGCRVSSGPAGSPCVAWCVGAGCFPAGQGLGLRNVSAPPGSRPEVQGEAGRGRGDQVWRITSRPRPGRASPGALAGLLLFKAQVQEMDVVVGRKETFRPLYWDLQSHCVVAA